MIEKLNYLKEKKNLLKVINDNQKSYYSKGLHFRYGLDYQKEISLYKVSGKFTLNEIQKTLIKDNVNLNDNLILLITCYYYYHFFTLLTVKDDKLFYDVDKQKFNGCYTKQCFENLRKKENYNGYLLVQHNSLLNGKIANKCGDYPSSYIDDKHTRVKRENIKSHLIRKDKNKPYYECKIDEDYIEKYHEIVISHNSYHSDKKYNTYNDGYENIYDFVDKSGYIKGLWTNELNKKLTIYKENIQKEKFKNFNHLKYMEELKAYSKNIEINLRALDYKTKEDIDKARNILWDVRYYFRDLETLEYKVNERNREMQYDDFMNRYKSIKKQYNDIVEKLGITL